MRTTFRAGGGVGAGRFEVQAANAAAVIAVKKTDRDFIYFAVFASFAAFAMMSSPCPPPFTSGALRNATSGTIALNVVSSVG